MGMKVREFRIWDREDNKMLYSGYTKLHGDNVQLHIDIDGYLIGYKNDDKGENGLYEHQVDIPTDRFVVIQSTGLLDCDGKKIWDGDVLQDDDKETFYEIEWANNGGTFLGVALTPVSPGNLYVSLRPLNERAAVVGNIYEGYGKRGIK